MKFYKLTRTQMFFTFGGLALVAVSLVVVMRPAAPTVPLNDASAKPTVQMQAMKSELPPTTATVAVEQRSDPVIEKSASNEVPQVAWQVGNPGAATPSIPLNEKISVYSVVELQRPDSLPVIGQQVQLPMLNGKTLVADVQSTVINGNGDYTWSGHLQGYGTDYPIVMTYGEHSIFATITTPEGSYTMESVDGLGWLYKNPAEIELSAPGAKDFLEVDLNK